MVWCGVVLRGVWSLMERCGAVRSFAMSFGTSSRDDTTTIRINVTTSK